MRRAIIITVLLALLVLALASGGCSRSTTEAGTSLHRVVLLWDAPTTNADGTPCTDLAGYKVYQGVQSGSYSKVYDTGSTATTYELQLPDGYYCFVVTAYDTSGNESDYSNEVCTELYTVVPDTVPPAAPVNLRVKEAL